ncbi:MAG: hypothetical protein IH787_00675 [Nitrospirae bacterium]|nr:hypothetical protein [Nitrospirota bacterium]
MSNDQYATGVMAAGPWVAAGTAINARIDDVRRPSLVEEFGMVCPVQ